MFGVEQPAVANSEDFILGVDADNIRTILSETGFFSYTTLAVPVGNTIPILKVLKTAFSHSYIRAKNNIIIQIQSDIDILSGWSILVYIDYLDFEYELYGDTGSCIIQLTENTPSLSDNCIREGNRFRIKIKAASVLLQDTNYIILINNVPTPDF